MGRSHALSCLLWLLLAFGLVATARAQSVIKLPIVAEITGGGASVGAMWRDAVAMAVEDINRKGGILGTRLETSVQTTCSPPPRNPASSWTSG